MLGGYQILDLRKIDLEITSEAQTITNPSILKQLSELREHIEINYDFSKPLEKQLKPILLRYRDNNSDEELEGACFGELLIKDNFYTFQISARVKSQYSLVLNVVFDLITLDSGDKVWVIDSATYILTNKVSGDIVIDGNLEVEGNVVAETLRQTQANFIHEFDLMVEDTTNFEQSGIKYCRIEEVNGEVHIIVFIKFHNKDTANAHSTRLALYTIEDIPEYISKKIFGEHHDISTNNAGIIRIAPLGIRAGTDRNIDVCELASSQANKITFYQGTARSVPADGYIYFSLEVNLSLF